MPSMSKGHRICTHCQRPVILSPSAEARAKNYGETPEFYKALFPAHSECIVKARTSAAVELMHMISAQAAADRCIV